jgi:CheY-like chemotaxis protein
VARILVVDDERDVRELFNITLKMAGHTTETAKDGVEAVDKLDDPLPDLILLDLMMPNMDGFAFLAHLRDQLEDRPLRVLVATAKVLEEDDQRQLAAWPVVGVLSKAELDIAQMVNVVGRALAKDPHRKNGRTKRPSQPEKPAQKAAPEAPSPPPPKSAERDEAARPEKPGQATAPALSASERAAKPAPSESHAPEPPAEKPGAPDHKPSLLERLMAARKKPPGEQDGET